MMNLKNCCMFTGRFTKDPELKTKGSGKNQMKYCMFTLGVSRQLTKDQRDEVKNGNPNNIITSDFPQFTAFGETAQIICDYFEKGKPITVHAQFQSYKKDDGNGNVEYKSNFVVKDIGFTEKDNSGSNGGNNGGSRNNNSNNNNSNRNNRPANKPAPAQPEDDVTIIDDDDVPF